MWLSTNKGFLSIVSNPAGVELLLVRARRKGDIETLFPDALVTRTPGRDYLFRASVTRVQVGEAVSKALQAINYGNFKNSVKDDRLHTAYGSVWSTMSKLQTVAPYGRDPAPAGPALPAAPAKRKAAATKKTPPGQSQLSMQEFDSIFPK